ncbi:hypothetical protein JHK82_022198 [Glycine max]|nr:hypothetical protein JHK82_022198 [Glycine max]
MNGRTLLRTVIPKPQQHHHHCRGFSTYDIGTCISTLQSCAHNANLSKGKELHTHLLKNAFFKSPIAITNLINMYSKCSLINHSLRVFNFPTHHNKNIFAYNALIAGFLANAFPQRALALYNQMRHLGIALDKFTFPCVIRACGDDDDGFMVMKIHGLLFKLGLELDVFVGSALVNTYLKFGLVKEAYRVFEELPVRDVVLWNAMVNGFVQIGRFEEALRVFRRMEGNRVCVRDDGRDIYFSWNSIMSVHERCSDHYGTLRLFDRMMRSNWVQPDLVIVTTILPACTHLAALMHGREIHGYMVVNGLAKEESHDVFDDVLLNNALMDMYAKCGNIRDARMVFVNMREKDVASWNIMITGYRMHGYGGEALDFFLVCVRLKWSLLVACRLHNDIDLAEVAASKVIELEPYHCENYVLMPNVYGVVGQYEEVLEWRYTMKQQNVKKRPGYSWIELVNGVKPLTEGGLCQNQDEEASDVSLNNDDSGDNLSDTTTP